MSTTYVTPTNMQFYGGRYLRVFVNGKELPVVQAGVDEGRAQSQKIQHSLSNGGTDIDDGMKDPASYQLSIAHDLLNDPFNKTGLNLRTGQRIDLLEIFPYGGTAATPTGPKHVLTHATIETNGPGMNINNTPTIQIAGMCSTRNYDYVPMTPPTT